VRILGAALLGLALASGVGADAGAAEWCGDVEHARPGVAKGAGQAELLAVEGSVAVVRVSGPYDRHLDGEFNQAVRAAVATEAIRAFGDRVDFLTVLTTFDFDRAGADAFAVGIQNDVDGIGRPIFDYSQDWGSDGELELYVDLGPIAERELDPVRPGFERTLTVALHELFHRWLFSPTIDQAGLPANALTGVQGSHWSFLADSDASLLYGADWRDDGDGGHTAVQVLRRLSPLDLYLSGFYAADEVPPVRLILDPNQDSAALPFPGARAFGPVVEVPIDSVLAGLGPRIPAVDTSPKSFRAGFVVLVRDDIEPVPTRSIERLAEQVATRFAILTAGRARLEAAVAAEGVVPGSAEPVGGVPSGHLPVPDLPAALFWLRNRQALDGSWADTAATTIRDTALAARTLTLLDASWSHSRRAAARSWLRAADTSTVDGLVWALIGAGVLEGPSDPEIDRRAALVEAAARMGDVWGPHAEFSEGVLDTALASLHVRGPDVLWFLERQNVDGGWGVAAGGRSQVNATTAVLRRLARAGASPSIELAGQRAAAWLLSQQGPDGGFGDDGSTAMATALVLESLIDAGRLPGAATAPALAYLQQRQRVDGSWEGSVAATAAVAAILPRAAAPNLSFVGSASAVPSTAVIGEPVTLGATVSNQGNAPTPASTLRWSLDGEVIGETQIPGLVPLQRVERELVWDTTTVTSGSRTVLARLDPEDLIPEGSELDNTTSVEVVLDAAPAGAELAVSAAEIALIPARPDHLPSTVELLAVVRNVGLTPALGVRVVVAIPEGPVLADQAIDLAARSSTLVAATVPIEGPDAVEVVVLVDPDEVVSEEDEVNNLAVARIEPLPTFDAVVDAAAVVVTPIQPLVGELLEVAAEVRNGGTLDIPAVESRVDIRVDGVLVFSESWTTPISVLGTTARTIPWLVDRTGTIEVAVTTDVGDHLPERDETNNLVVLELSAASPDSANLVVDPLATDPAPLRQGLPGTILAPIRNVGGVDAGSFEVAAYDGDPEAGGLEIGRTMLSSLGVGQTAVASLTWPTVPDPGVRLIFVVVDPEDEVPETRGDDNTAWLEVDPAGLADLAVSASSVAFEPAAPVAGQSVTILVEVANLGEQVASDVTVHVSAGSEVIGEVEIPAVNAGAVETAAFPWTTPDIPSLVLTIAVDPVNSVEELDEGNNGASLNVVLQSGAASVNERFFSPNGDGVKDLTTLTYGLDDAGPKRLEIRDRYSRVRREVDLGSAPTGEWTWDGKDEIGRVQRDGEWTLAVVGLTGDLATAVVTLDTNRSPLGDAAGTGLELTKNLSCGPFGGTRSDVTLDERHVFIDWSAGISRLRLEDLYGSSVVPPSWFAARIPPAELDAWVLDPMTLAIAFAAAPRPPFAAPGSVYLADGGGVGTEFSEFHDTGLRGRPVFFGVGGRVVVDLDGTLAVYDPATRTSRSLAPLEAPFNAGMRERLVSPDGSKATLANGAELLLVDLVTDQRVFLGSYSEMDELRVVWGRGGNVLVVADSEAPAVDVFDGAGHHLARHVVADSPPLVDLGRGGTETVAPTDIRAPSLDDSETRVAMVVEYFGLEGLWVLELASGSWTNIAWTGEVWGEKYLDDGGGSAAFGGPAKDGDIGEGGALTWIPGSDQLLYSGAPGPTVLDAVLPTLAPGRPVPEHWGLWAELTPAGESLLFWSFLESRDPESSCYSPLWPDTFHYRSLLNLENEIRVWRPTDGRSGFVISGIAADRNLSRRRLEAIRIGGSADPVPIGVPAANNVVDGDLGIWAPPAPGSWLVRQVVEDRAGNVRTAEKRVEIAEVDRIAGLLVEPENYSPLVGELSIRFDLLGPIQTEIVIRDEWGTAVRSLPASFPCCAGETIEVRWNGRDVAGRLVEDGEFWVSLLGFEVPFRVDQAPPVIRLGTTGPGDLVDHVVAERLGCAAEIGDPNLDFTSLRSAWLPRGSATWVPWDSTFIWCPFEPNCALGAGSIKTTVGSGSSCRFEARDYHGNHRVEVAQLPEQIGLTRVGAFGVDSAGARWPLAPVVAGMLAFPPSIFGAAPYRMTSGVTAIGVAESVLADVVELRLVRETYPFGQGGEVSEVIRSFLRPGEVSEHQSPPEGGFDILVDPSGWSTGVVHLVKVAAIDAEGVRTESNTIQVIPVGVTFRGRAWPPREFSPLVPLNDPERVSWTRLADLLRNIGRQAEGLAWARHHIDVPLTSSVLELWSEEDIAYRERVQVPSLAFDDAVIVFELPDDLDPRFLYQARVLVTTVPVPPAGGGSPVPLLVPSAEQDYRPPKLGVRVEKIAPLVTGSECGQRFDEALDLSLQIATVGDAPLAALTIEREVEDGDRDVLFTDLSPEPGLLPVVLATHTWAEGEHSLLVSLTDTADERVTGTVQVFVDRQAPEVAIVGPAPLPSGTLCEIPELEIRVRDRASVRIHDWLSRPPPDPENASAPYPCSTLPVSPDRYCAVPQGSPLEWQFGRRMLQGEPLRVVDASGNASCVSLSYDLDGVGEADSMTLAPAVISPDGDGRAEQTVVSAEVREPMNLGIEVIRGTQISPLQCKPVHGAPVLRTIDLGQVVPGIVHSSFDGRSDAGAVLPDEVYYLGLIGADSCGHPPVNPVYSGGSKCLTIDTIPPDVDVVHPAAGARLPIAAEVRVRASDVGSGVHQVSVDYGAGVDPMSWSALGLSRVGDEWIASWNTYGLEGDYTIRVTATDGAEHTAEERVPVILGGQVVVISDLRATPSPFSPNGDGRRDDAAVRLSLEGEARLRLTIRAAGGAVVRTLSDTVRSPGTIALTWDGWSDSGSVAPDGPYRVVAEAYLVGEPAPVQTEEVSLELDATPPALGISAPEVGAVRDLPVVVSGSISDTNISSWQLDRGPGAQGPWTELASGASNRSLADLTTIADDLSEGLWVLRLRASDLAENEAELITEWTLDRTPPQVALREPIDNTLFGPAEPEIVVDGLVDDLHLESWKLSVVPTGAAAPRSTVAEGDGPRDGQLGILAASALPDGSWTLELEAEDQAGHAAETSARLRLDRRPPDIGIVAPASGAWVRGPVSVIGSVQDLHLLDWTLMSAPGATPPAEAFSTVARGSVAAEENLGIWILLPPDGPATLRLTAVDAVGNNSTLDRLVQIDTVPPPRPLLLTAERIAHRDVLLEWNAVVDPHLAGYVLERGSLRITPTPVPGPTFTDVGVPDGIHEYRVRAVDLAGNESEPSAPAVVAIDSTPPVVQIAVPSAGSWIRGLTNVEGTARSTQDDFREYWLEVGSEALGWAEFRRSPAPVIAAHLGSWTPPQALDGATVRFRLSASDLADNVATTEVEVQIDLSAPAAPIELVATPAPEPSEDVILTWTASIAPDLAGYVVLRGGAARFPWEEPIEPTTWTDPSVPDGTFTWTVVAVDHAGNQSAESNPATLTLDRHPPRAVIRTPVEGHRFDGPLAVLATSEDRDVATVQLEWRLPDGPWTPLAAPLSAEPWTTTLDPEALVLPLGPVELRAVATDLGGRVDPDPQVTTIEYADLTAPPVPLLLVAAIDGDVATLTWDATGSDATSFRIEERFDPEDPEYLEVVGEVPVPTTVLPDLPPGLHHWQVVAIDDAGNESEPSNLASGLVHRPLVSRHMTPRLDPAVDLAGTAEIIEGVVQVRVQPEGGSVEVIEVPLGADGQIEVPTVPLTSGDQSVEVRVVDPDGNRSLPDTLWLFLDQRPAAPAGLAAAVDGFDVTLTWEVSTEADHLGWRVWRNGVVSPAQAAAAIVEAIGDEWTSPPSFAIDGDPETAWEIPDAEESQLELELGSMVIVDRLEFLWANEAELLRAPLELRIDAWDGRDWIPVAAFAPLADPAWTVPLDRPYRTSRLRLAPRGSVSGERYLALALAELQVVEGPVVEGPPEWLETVADGVSRWEVEQVDTNGFVSDRAVVEATVGDIDPPLPVILSGSVETSDASLSWTASESPDVVAYDLRRDGVLILRTPDLATIDPGLPNGTYTYEVRALDAAFNESPPSNEVALTVFVEAPSGVIELEVSAAPEGDALDLAWTWSLPELPAGGFRVRRGLIQGGPWAPRATTAARAFRDDQVDVGVTYYYLVEALDQVGNAGPPSNEASGSLVDLEPPPVPVPFFPGGVGDHVQTVARQQDFAAWAEPGVEVRLIRNGVDASTTVATSAWANTAVPGLDVSYSPEVSPDGRWLVAFVHDDDGVLVARTVDRSGQIVSGTLALDGARWSDSSTEFVGWRNGEVWRFDPTGTGVRLWQADAVVAVPRDSTRSVIVVTEEQGLVEVWERDDLSSEADLIASFTEDESGSVWHDSVVLSPGGLQLAWQDDYGLAVVDLGAGILNRVHWNASGWRPAWSPDGRWLAWTTWDNTTAVYDSVTGGWSDFGDDDEFSASWSPSGEAVALLDGSGVPTARSWPEGQVLDDPGFPSTESWRAWWLPSGELVLHGADRLLRMATPPGRASFVQIPLLPGVEAFYFAAVDDFGNRSAAAGPVSVERLSPSGPDLVVPEFGVGVAPAAPAIGEQVRITASAGNVGSETAAASRLRASLLTADGQWQQVIDTPVPALAPGATFVRDVLLPMPGPAGLTSLVVEADATGVVIETDETNNRRTVRVPVGQTASADLTLSLDRTLYGPGIPIEATTTVDGFGAPIALVLRRWVADGAGVVIEELEAEDLGILLAGERRELVATWSHASVFSGSYQFVAQLSDPFGTAIVERTATFEVAPWHQIVASIIPRPSAAERGAAFDLDGRLEIVTGNALLVGAEAVLEVRSAAGVLEHEVVRPLGVALPGTVMVIGSQWQSGTAAAGLRGVHLQLRRDGVVLASASALLEVMPLPAVIAGDLDAPAEVVLGTDLAWSSEVENTGDLPLEAMPIRVRLLDGTTLAELGTLSTSMTVPPAAPVTWSGQFSSADLAPGAVLLVLEGSLDGAFTLLDQATVLALDRTPPELEVLVPTPGQVLGHEARLIARATDRHGNPVMVEAAIDGGALSPAPSLDVPGRARGCPRGGRRSGRRVRQPHDRPAGSLRARPEPAGDHHPRRGRRRGPVRYRDARDHRHRPTPRQLVGPPRRLGVHLGYADLGCRRLRAGGGGNRHRRQSR
jgi:subtilase family serine protease/flagellar hook assembly protein FlgD